MAIPAILMGESISSPIREAPMAEIAGTRAENVFVRVIPILLITLIQSTKQRQEHKRARVNSGIITSAVKKSLFTPSIPCVRKVGKNSTAPIKNWYVAIVKLLYLEVRRLAYTENPTAAKTAIISNANP